MGDASVVTLSSHNQALAGHYTSEGDRIKQTRQEILDRVQTVIAQHDQGK